MLLLLLLLLCERAVSAPDAPSLQNATLLPLLGICLEGGARRRLEHFAHAVLCLCRALEIGDGVYGLGDLAALLEAHGLLLDLGQLAPCLLVLSQVLLVADENDGHARAKVTHLGLPLLCDVLQAVRVVDAEAHDDHVRVRVGQWPQAIVVLLAGCSRC